MRRVAGAVRDGSGHSIEGLKHTPLVGAPTADGFAARRGVVIWFEDAVVVCRGITDVGDVVVSIRKGVVAQLSPVEFSVRWVLGCVVGVRRLLGSDLVIPLFRGEGEDGSGIGRRWLCVWLGRLVIWGLVTIFGRYINFIFVIDEKISSP